MADHCVLERIRFALFNVLLAKRHVKGRWGGVKASRNQALSTFVDWIEITQLVAINWVSGISRSRTHPLKWVCKPMLWNLNANKKEMVLKFSGFTWYHCTCLLFFYFLGCYCIQLLNSHILNLLKPTICWKWVWLFCFRLVQSTLVCSKDAR